MPKVSYGTLKVRRSGGTVFPPFQGLSAVGNGSKNPNHVRRTSASADQYHGQYDRRLFHIVLFLTAVEASSGGFNDLRHFPFASESRGSLDAKTTLCQIEIGDYAVGIFDLLHQTVVT